MPKKKNKTLQEMDNFSAEIEALADAVLDNIDCEFKDVLDPFEIYLKRVHAEVFSKSNHFKVRLENGYRVLLHELSKSV